MQPLCAHVAIINYFNTFPLGMWVFKPPSKLPAVAASLHCRLKASQGSTPSAAPVFCVAENQKSSKSSGLRVLTWIFRVTLQCEFALSAEEN